jgi:RNA polymerase sigma-70 factor (ECF subfamily)
VAAEEAADVVQEVFLTVFKGIRTFTNDGRPAAFRRWLKAITRFKVLEYCRDRWRRFNVPCGSGSSLDPGYSPDIGGDPDLSEVAEDGVPVRLLLLRRLLELIRPDFKPCTWDAFWETAAKGRPAKDVAKDLGMRVGAVHTAKSRVLKRLREEAETLELYRAEGDVVTA